VEYEYDQSSFMHMYENRIIKPVKIVLKRRSGRMRKHNRVSTFDQSILNVFTEIYN
jgi:hypothetical protein